MRDNAPILFMLDPKEPAKDDLFLTPRWETALIVVLAVAMVGLAFWMGRESVRWWQ